MVSQTGSVQSSRWDGAIFLIFPSASCLAWSLDISCFTVAAAPVLSQRDGAIVAWHGVPGTASPRKSRPVGYGLIRAGVRTDSTIGATKQLEHPRTRTFQEEYLAFLNTAHLSTRNTSGISCARSYRTLRDGSFEGRFPRHFVPGYDRTVPPGHIGTAAAVKR